MTFDRINPPGLAAPRGFSHAVTTTRQRTVYLAGQTALDADARIVGDDVVSQFEQALSNLLAALAAAGGSGTDLATGAKWFVMAATATTVLGAVVAVVLGRRLARPVRDASDAAHRLAAADALRLRAFRP